jgi:hypothetical protein
METYISPVIAWQNIMFYNILYVSIYEAIFNTIKTTILQDANIFKSAHWYVGEVWYHKGHQRHKGSPYSPVNKPQRRVHTPLSDALECGTTPLHKVLGRAPQLNWRLPIGPPSSYTQS